MAYFAYVDSTAPQNINVLRSAWNRVQDFSERDRVLTSQEAQIISAQCGMCKTPACGNQETQRRIPRGTIFVPSSGAGFSLPQLRLDNLYACPLGNRIPDWELAVQRGDFGDAFEIAMRTNLWADITGQVCPPGICESSCNLNTSGHWHGHIRSIERFIGDHGWENGLFAPLHVENILRKKVAIIGAGPAGFYPGHDLRSLGCEVTYFDANDVPGGLTTRGLPGMKISNHRITRHFDRLERAGVKFRTNTKVGYDIGFDQIAAEFDAILIATGAYNYRVAPGVSGSGVKAIIQGIPYLQTQNRRDDGQTPAEFTSGRHNAFGKHVIVVGAGDTAFDTVGTIFRQQIDPTTGQYKGKVTVVVRGDQMRAIEKEIKANKEEAEAIAQKTGHRPEDILDIRFQTQLAAVDGTEDKITSVVLRDSSGTEKLDAQMVVMAVGSGGINYKELFGLPRMNQNDDGMIHAIPWKGRPGTRWQGGGLVGLFRSKTHLTERYVPVYAAGDITRDRSQRNRSALLVYAIADGRDTVTDLIYGLQNSEQILESNRELILN
jgi:glutamate synthase (NADPH/NADH) small chain